MPHEDVITLTAFSGHGESQLDLHKHAAFICETHSVDTAR